MAVPRGGRTVFVISFSFFVLTKKTNVSVLFAVNIDDAKYEHAVGSTVLYIVNNKYVVAVAFRPDSTLYGR